ncbi:MAG: endolytic transglycosylase MltG [Cyclobacteriaceae bacterium]
MLRSKFLQAIILGGGCLFIVFTFYFYQIFQADNFQIDKDDVAITVYPNTTFSELRKDLLEKEILHDQISFSFISKILKYQENVKPGRYVIERDMNNWKAVRKLRAGNQDPLKLTFNNVRKKEDLAGKLAKNLMIDSLSILSLLADQEVLTKYGFNEQNILGMFIPNSYEMYWTVSGEQVLKKMHTEYNAFWTTARKNQAAKIGLSPKEVSTLASIVEAETAQNDERPRVAGVYINRLKRDMLLQADPTVKYAVGDFMLKRILFKHLKVDSPYNTYKYKGLPPGPINCPSVPSLKAVLNYEKHSYIYFCAREDFSGYHNFAKNGSEHNRNRDKYIKALNAAGIR